MNKNLKVVLWKVLFLAIFFGFMHFVFKVWEPLTTADMALKQLEDSDSATAEWTAYSTIKELGIWPSLVLIVVVFFREIKLVIKHFTEKEGQ